MSRSVQEEVLSVLWFILALLLWQCGHKILSILTLLKGIECAILSIALAIIGAIEKFKALQVDKVKK